MQGALVALQLQRLLGGQLAAPPSQDDTPACLLLLLLQEMEFTVEFSRLAEWIGDVKRIINMDLLENGKAKCVLLFCMFCFCHWIQTHG
jgi:hypothetical protein